MYFLRSYMTYYVTNYFLNYWNRTDMEFDNQKHRKKFAITYQNKMETFPDINCGAPHGDLIKHGDGGDTKRFRQELIWI